MIEKYILDSSVLAKVFLEDEIHQELAVQVLKGAIEKRFILSAPSLILYELNNIFVKNGLPFEDIQRHFIDISFYVSKNVIDIRFPSYALLLNATKITQTDTKGKGHISAYDATFHALALQEKAVFLTADKKHYEKTHDKFGAIMLLEDWKF